MDHTPLLLTRSQAARLLGISAEYVRQLSLSGRLPCHETPLGRLYDVDAVEAYAKERAARQQGPS